MQHDGCRSAQFFMSTDLSFYDMYDNSNLNIISIFGY